MLSLCTRCGESKPADEFHFRNRQRGTRLSICKTCNVAMVREWRAANPEKAAEQRRLYRERHRDDRNAKALARYYRLMEENPESVRKQRRDWAKTPKGVVASRASHHLRRGARLTKEAREWWLSLVDPKCHYCDAPGTEIDHVIPVSRGGTGELSNVVPACRRCNASKNDSLLEVG